MTGCRIIFTQDFLVTLERSSIGWTMCCRPLFFGRLDRGRSLTYLVAKSLSRAPQNRAINRERIYRFSKFIIKRAFQAFAPYTWLGLRDLLAAGPYLKFSGTLLGTLPLVNSLVDSQIIWLTARIPKFREIPHPKADKA